MEKEAKSLGLGSGGGPFASWQCCLDHPET
jgi:hypothetical protein